MVSLSIYQVQLSDLWLNPKVSLSSHSLLHHILIFFYVWLNWWNVKLLIKVTIKLCWMPFFVKQVSGSLLPASVISVYCAYLCYTALSCEPHHYKCNGLNNSKAVSISTLILGMLTTVLSVLYSALRAGSSTAFLSPPSSPKSGNEIWPKPPGPVLYIYLFCKMHNAWLFI